MRDIDAFVIGGGPAGCWTAYGLARAGFAVVLAEKRPEIGVPVRCGEAAGSLEELEHFLPLEDTWIAGSIDGARLFGPSGRCVERALPGIGTQLHRDRFDQALARQAASAGAAVHTGMQVDAVGDFAGGRRVVRGHHVDSGEPFAYAARLVVGADGVESQVGQWLGLRRHFTTGEVHAALQYLLDGVDDRGRFIELYTGLEIAPRGYAWVFPKDHGTANVGIGIHVSRRNRGTAKDYLDRFVRDHFPDSRILRTVAGGVSGARSLKRMVTDGAVLVGEAGHTNNPFSGGGIMNALESSEEAVAVLVPALQAGDVTAARLAAYPKRWRRRVGRTNDLFYKLRKLFFKLEDHEIDWAVESLRQVCEGLDRKDVDYTGIFRRALLQHPKLVLKAGSALW